MSGKKRSVKAGSLQTTEVTEISKSMGIADPLRRSTSQASSKLCGSIPLRRRLIFAQDDTQETMREIEHSLVF